MRDLAPFGLRKIEKIEEFKELYCTQLDRIGVDKINEQLRYYESLGKPVVLLCFEDIRKGADYRCHINVFVSWWFEKTVDLIPELEDNFSFKV